MANLRLRENGNKSMKFLYEQFQVKITTRLKEDRAESLAQNKPRFMKDAPCFSHEVG